MDLTPSGFSMPPPPPPSEDACQSETHAILAKRRVDHYCPRIYIRPYEEIYHQISTGHPRMCASVVIAISDGSQLADDFEEIILKSKHWKEGHLPLPPPGGPLVLEASTSKLGENWTWETWDVTKDHKDFDKAWFDQEAYVNAQCSTSDEAEAQSSKSDEAMAQSPKLVETAVQSSKSVEAGALSLYQTEEDQEARPPSPASD